MINVFISLVFLAFAGFLFLDTLGTLGLGISFAMLSFWTVFMIKRQ